MPSLLVAPPNPKAVHQEGSNLSIGQPADLHRKTGALTNEKRPEFCPACRSTRFSRSGTFQLKNGTRKQRYRCCDCGKYFNCDTGTPKANLKRQKEWDEMQSKMAETISLRSMARLLGVHLSTAFRWRHRWMAAQCKAAQGPLGGRVSVTIGLVPYSEKGSRLCRGPGSWGYWDWIRRRSPRPGGSPPRDRMLPPFRRLIEGRPIQVLQVQNESNHAAYILGQGKPDEDLIEYALSTLVTSDAKVYGFTTAPIKAVCQELSLSYQDGRKATYRLQRFLASRGNQSPFSMPVQTPYRLDDWIGMLRNVATKYLERYLAWFNYQVNYRLQLRQAWKAGLIS